MVIFNGPSQLLLGSAFENILFTNITITNVRKGSRAHDIPFFRAFKFKVAIDNRVGLHRLLTMVVSGKYARFAA